MLPVRACWRLDIWLRVMSSRRKKMGGGKGAGALGEERFLA
jgi:hypothetical protein